MSNPSKAAMILADIRRLETVLGRFPSRDAYLDDPNALYAKSDIVECFGSWTQMLLAEGVQYSKLGKRNKQEIRLQAFEHLKKEIESKKQILAVPPPLVRHALVLSDRHKPYHHQDSVPFILAVEEKYRSAGRPFDLVVDIGDGEDFHAMSFHDSDPELLSAGHELEAVILANQPIYSRFPKMKIMDSNHSSMVFRKGKHHGIPRNVLKSYQEILRAPDGWTWHPELVVQMTDGSRWMFCHSYGSNVLQVSQKRGMSVVQGHHHSKFCVQAWVNATGLHWAVQTGCLIDDVSMAFAYNKTTVERPVMGMIRIENGIPHLLPMLVDSKNRWTGFIP